MNTNEEDLPFTTIEANSARLRFIEGVDEAFGFLVPDYGFIRRQQGPGQLRFAGKTHFVRVRLYAPCPEVDISIGPIILGRCVTLLARSFEKIASPVIGTHLIPLGETNAEELHARLQTRAEQLRSIFGPVLSGEWRSLRSYLNTKTRKTHPKKPRGPRGY